MKNLLPKIYKESKRFSRSSKPPVGSIAFFSPTINLTVSIQTACFPSFDCEEIHSNAEVLIIRNIRNLSEVRFEGKHETDFVPFDWLERRKLTDFGRAFSGAEMSAKIRKILLGA